MNLAWVVIRIDIGGGWRVCSVCSTADKAEKEVENLKKDTMTAHALTYSVPLDANDLPGAPPEPQYESQDIYLRSPTGAIIGLHAVGEYAEWDEVQLDGVTTVQKKGLMPMEQWGNEYDENFNMIGRGSFRVHGDLEDAAKDFEADGWIRFEREK